MFLSKKTIIAEEIVRLLSEGGQTTLDLLKKLRRTHSVTKQGFYKSLGELVDQEIILKNKQLVLLNNTWVNKLHRFIEVIDEHYQSPKSEESFLSLSEGESLVYHFKLIASLDALWMHYFFLITKKEIKPVIMYSPHEWFSVIRPEVEEFMYSWLKEIKRESYSVVGHNTELDRNTTAYIKSEYMQVAYEEKPSFRPTLYSTVIGDYIIDTVIDSETTEKIHDLYLKFSEWKVELRDELVVILSNIKRSKVIITRNKKRAELIRRKLMKYFTFYK